MVIIINIAAKDIQVGDYLEMPDGEWWSVEKKEGVRIIRLKVRGFIKETSCWVRINHAKQVRVRR